LCDRVAFVRGGLLRIDSPAGLRDSLGGHGVEVGLAGAPSPGLVAAARAVDGVTAVDIGDRRLIVSASDPATVTPSLVRVLVAAGADIVEIRERATTLEQVYFEVMGVRADHDEAA